MIGSDLLRLGVFCALPFADSPRRSSCLAGVAGLATGFFRPAVYAGLPNLVPDEELANANALLQGVENARLDDRSRRSAACSSRLSSPDAAYWINAATFLLSALLLLRIPAAAAALPKPLTAGHWHDLAEGFSVVRHSRALMTVLVVWNIVFVGTAAVNVAEVVARQGVARLRRPRLRPARRRVRARAHARQPLGGAALERFGIGALYSRLDRGDGARASRRPRSRRPCGWPRLRGRRRASGTACALVCNALLVQRGAPDRLRGRAFTMHHELELRPLGAGDGGRGPADGRVGGRWMWGGAAPRARGRGRRRHALARGRAREQVGRARASSPTPSSLSVGGTP